MEREASQLIEMIQNIGYYFQGDGGGLVGVRLGGLVSARWDG